MVRKSTLSWMSQRANSRFTLPSHLSAYDTLEIFQSSPVQSPLPTTGKIEIAAAPPPANTCVKGQKPCMNQPQEGDTTVCCWNS
jgi:hypothetical protein